MKSIHLAAMLAFAVAGPAFAGGAHDHPHGHAHRPLHGGIVSEVRDVEYELVARPDSLQLHLRDHGQPVDVAKASAKLTLLVGTAKQEVVLTPAGTRFDAKGNFQLAGGKAVALVALPGKAAVTVRFALK